MPEHVHLLVSEPGPTAPGPTVPQVRVRSLDANLGPPPLPSHSGRCPPLSESLFHKTSSRTNRRNRFLLAETLPRPQRARRRRVQGEVALPPQEPRQARIGNEPRRLEVEQFPSLCPAGSGIGGDRIPVDRFRSGNEDHWWTPAPVPKPRLASKGRTRTWGTGLQRLQRIGQRILPRLAEQEVNMLRHDYVPVNLKPEPARVPHPKNRALCDFRVGGFTLTRRFFGAGKQTAAMIAAESNEMTLPLS